MRKIIITGFIALLSAGLWSCHQNEADSVESESAVNAARLSSDTTGFFFRNSLTKVEISALPATVTNYISASYAGATVNYAVKDDTGNFLVAIKQNDQRRIILFNADGTFNTELTLPGGGKGPGRGHRGGGRDSLTKVAVADLLVAIRNYITTNFATATIATAVMDATRGYLVMIIQDNRPKALLFNADGTFNQEVVRGPRGKYTAVDASTLPAVVTAYITTNYAGATIKVAGKNTTGQFKVIVQPINGRFVELLFAADGTFVQARSRR